MPLSSAVVNVMWLAAPEETNQKHLKDSLCQFYGHLIYRTLNSDISTLHCDMNILFDISL